MFARSFWKGLPRPFFALAPMEDVTDTVFRRIVAGLGRPDVCFTEFINVEAILSAVRSSQNSVPAAWSLPAPLRAANASTPALQRLVYLEEERPIAAQIWGTEPERFYQAAKAVAGLGFDGVDINLGCPVREVVKIGACAAMIEMEKRDRVKEIIQAAKEGAGGLPVSVKTRIGFKKIVTEDWIGFLLGQGLAAITVHGRTAAEMSRVPAHWGEIEKAVKIRDSIFGGSGWQSHVLASGHQFHWCSRKRGPAARVRFASPAPPLIVGNGDVKSLEEARQKVEMYGVDGVMIGRAALENPAVFSGRQAADGYEEKVKLLKKHLELWEETWGEAKNFAVFKKYIKVYVRDFAGAGDLRAKLMEAKTFSGMVRLVEETGL